jgi:hypothetical protein
MRAASIQLKLAIALEWGELVGMGRQCCKIKLNAALHPVMPSEARDLLYSSLAAAMRDEENFGSA